MRATEQVLKAQERQAAAERQRGDNMTTQLDEPFDVDNEEGSKFDLLPKGTYKAEIMGAAVKVAKSGRGQYVSITWQIVEGEFERRNVFQNVTIQHDSEKAQRFGRGMFKDIASACGISGQLTDLSVLCFRPCAIKVGIEEDKTGEYDDKNKVVRVLPVGAMATPEQMRQKRESELLREASKTPPAFKATGEDLNDEIPY
jgi:hypothetical protein